MWFDVGAGVKFNGLRFDEAVATGAEVIAGLCASILTKTVGLDEAATGALFGAAITILGGRLVFTAQCSDDGGDGIVPASVPRAIRGAYSSNASVIRLAEEGGRIEVERKLERGNRQLWSAILPAVVAVEAGSVLVRYVSVAALILARRWTVETHTHDEFGENVEDLPQLNELKRPHYTPSPAQKYRCASHADRAARQGSMHEDGVRWNHHWGTKGEEDSLRCSRRTRNSCLKPARRT